MIDESNPLVSVVIPHWNHRDVLDDCLRSLELCEYHPLEIIVVDNHSTDDSVEFVQSNFPEIILLQNETNLGFAGGCNRGIEQARGEFIVILNNDTTHEPGWITTLVRFMEEHPETGIVQPKLLNAIDESAFDYSGAAGGYLDKYGFPFARGRILDSIEKDNGQYDSVAKIFWASGTACIIRAEVFEQIGKFDEAFFAHMEEIDFDWRAQLAGWKIFAVPDAVVWHHSGYTLPMESPLKKYLNHRNSVLMLLSNYQWLCMIIRGFQRFLLDGLALVHSLFTGEFSRAVAIVKAWFWILVHPGVIKKKRRQVAGIRLRSDDEMEQSLYQASIALERFLLRRTQWDATRHGLGD